MLVFNFTEAAAKHLCPEYRKGKELGFFEPSTTETVEQAFVSSESKKKMVFCVHVFKIGHYHNVVVVEYGTRWAHVIHKVKKGDLEDFMRRFHERLMNGIAWIGTSYKIFDLEQMDRGVSEFFACHDAVTFLVRGDRSCNSHITQIVSHYGYTYSRVGGYPHNEEEAMSYDLFQNGMLRNRKGAADYFNPKHEMLSRYLYDYMGWDDGKVLAAIAKVRAVDRMGLDAMVREVLNPAPSNVFQLFGEPANKTVH